MEKTEINGKNYFIEKIFSKNKNATARVKQNRIVIKIPRRWPEAEALRISAELENNIIKGIKNKPWRFIHPEITFNDGQEFTLLGKTFRIILREGKKTSRVRLIQDDVEVKLAEGLDEKTRKKKVYHLVRRVVSRSLLPTLKNHVEILNERHFKFQFKSVRIKEMTSRWGSCSSHGNINLSFYLLFAPEEILNYVIIHELAHLKIRNHGSAFWNLVENAIPDYKKKRKWLNENASKISTAKNTPPTLNSYF